MAMAEMAVQAKIPYCRFPDSKEGKRNMIEMATTFIILTTRYLM